MITHPEKVLFPDDGITKGELAAYYRMVAPVIVPQIHSRPVTMERYPKGIGEKGFMQKSVTRGFPPWLERVEVPKKGGTVHYPLITDDRSLLWLANQNCITPHVWTARAGALDRPDLCVFDLDPAGDEPARLRTAAVGFRRLLDEIGLASWVKTSGSKGFHIVVPLTGVSYAEVWRFAELVARVMVDRSPEDLTLEFAKTDRRGRIYLDIGRNGPGATFAAVYAVRARPGAPVSAPCTWDEVESGAVGPRTVTLRAMEARLDTVGDLWDGIAAGAVASLREPLARLESS